jgi:hypothetical protein
MCVADRVPTCERDLITQLYGLIEGAEVRKLRLAYAPSFVDASSGTTLSTVLLVAFDYVDPSSGATTAVDWRPWAMPAWGDTVTVAGSDVSFSSAWTAESDTFNPDLFAECDGVDVEEFDGPQTPATSSLSGTGTLDCADVADIWELVVPTRGALRVSVDTTAAGTAFDPAMSLNLDGCTIAFADDNFECTFKPTDYSCPAGAFDEVEPGTYTVAVWSYGSCVGTTGAYRVTVSGPAGSTLILRNDDVKFFPETTYEVVGSATRR